MKTILVTVFLFASLVSLGQRYSFNKAFKPGSIILKDSSEKTGEIKWKTGGKVKFREDGQARTKRYSAKDILGFKADTAAFMSLSEFRGYSNDFTIWGSTSRVKHVFGQLIETGDYDTYLVYLSYTNPHTHHRSIYPNIVFSKKVNGEQVYAAYPYHVRVGSRKLEKAKKHLYEFFNGNEEMIQKIKSYNKGQDFLSVVSSN